VIPTRDRREALAECLESVLRSDFPRLRGRVVDNAPSDDATRDMVTERFGTDPRVRYERLSAPGASAARNHGGGLGTGELLAFTDDDAVVGPLWLEALVDGFRDDHRVSCVSGLTLPAGLATPAQRAFESYGGMGRWASNRASTTGTATVPRPVSTRTRPASSEPPTTWRCGGTCFCPWGAGFDETLGPATPAFGA
jgi:GT2 family glycosyltransferase